MAPKRKASTPPAGGGRPRRLRAPSLRAREAGEAGPSSGRVASAASQVPCSIPGVSSQVFSVLLERLDQMDARWEAAFGANSRPAASGPTAALGSSTGISEVTASVPGNHPTTEEASFRQAATVARADGRGESIVCTPTLIPEGLVTATPPVATMGLALPLGTSTPAVCTQVWGAAAPPTMVTAGQTMVNTSSGLVGGVSAPFTQGCPPISGSLGLSVSPAGVASSQGAGALHSIVGLPVVQPPVSVAIGAAGVTQSHVATSTDPLTGAGGAIPRGLPSTPLGYHLHPSVREKIWRGEYIDLYTLLNREVPKKEREEEARTDRAKKVKVTRCFSSWLFAFLTYASVIVQKEPGRAVALLKYIDLIAMSYFEVKGDAWQLYDESFRMRVAYDNSLPWDREVPELWFQATRKSGSGKRTDSGHLMEEETPTSPSSSTGQGVRPPPECFEFSAKGSCARTVCKFRHACGKCGGSHATNSCGQQGGGKGRNKPAASSATGLQSGQP